MASDGIDAAKQDIRQVKNAGGGAIFVDEAYQLMNDSAGRQVLDLLMVEMEKNIGNIVFLFAGYNKQMEKFFERNPGLHSRLPYQLQFSDYSDAELLHMLKKLIEKKYKEKMKVENGIDGLYTRIAVRRLGRTRGKVGFGNARALQNMLAKISEAQAERLTRQRKEGLTPDDFLLTREDVIGPDPSQAIMTSSAWTKLQRLTGLATVKESILNLIGLINENYKVNFGLVNSARTIVLT